MLIDSTNDCLADFRHSKAVAKAARNYEKHLDYRRLSPVDRSNLVEVLLYAMQLVDYWKAKGQKIYIGKRCRFEYRFGSYLVSVKDSAGTVAVARYIHPIDFASSEIGGILDLQQWVAA